MSEHEAALAPSEWARQLNIGAVAWWHVLGRPEEPTIERRAVAALALYDQPFGFSRNDVTLLRYVADLIGAMHLDRHEEWTQQDIRDLADRIDVLLPPAGEDK